MANKTVVTTNYENGEGKDFGVTIGVFGKAPVKMNIMHCEPGIAKFEYPGLSEDVVMNELDIALRSNSFIELWPHVKQELLDREYDMLILDTVYEWNKHRLAWWWESWPFNKERVRDIWKWGVRFRVIYLTER